MVSAKEIYGYLDGIAPFGTAMSFDNAGLIVGGVLTCSEKVLVALDASAAVINEAEKKGASIVVSHHPVIFTPLRRLEQDEPAYLAARYGITIISAHTNLDIADGGVNDCLAQAIGVNTEERFPGECALVGTVSGFERVSGLAAHIKNRLRLAGLRYTDNGKCSRVVVACGAGGGSVELAHKLGADVVVTGEIKHNFIMYANDRNISVIDLGHYGSEKIIVPRLVDALSERFPEAVFERAESDKDGVCYL